jgi:SAM-dependent methyltransferase
MYQLLSQYYDQLFKFNPKLKDFLFPYVTISGRALDLGCGTGRLTKAIDELKMDVEGIDLDPFMIKIAQKKYPNIKFARKDMLEHIGSPQDKYDLITCFGNTLVHLEPDLLNQLFVHVKMVLNKSKYFVVQILNYQNILKEKPESLLDLTNEDILLKRNYAYFKDHIVFQTILFVGDDVYELGETNLYPYTHNYLMDLALQHGFSAEVYGNTDFSPYQYDDFHVYLVFKNI